MKLIFQWSPEMGVWTVIPEKGKTTIVCQEDIGVGGRYEKVAQIFIDAREAVESGRAVMGVHCTV